MHQQREQQQLQMSSHPSSLFYGGGAALIQTNFKSKTARPIVNCGPTEIIIPCGTTISQIETIFADRAVQINEATVAASIARGPTELPPLPSRQQVKVMLQDLTLTVPRHEKQNYIYLILCNHDIFSVDKNDLGRATSPTASI